jgi:DNA-binding MarR family transcriptional regulator
MQNKSGVAAALSLVLERLVPLMRQLSTAGDLNAAAAAVIALLAKEGPRRLTELATHQRVSQPGMTQLVARLEREGLVRRAPLAGDRRVVVVEPTGVAVELLERRRAERAAALDGLLSRLDPADRAAIRAALPALTRLASLPPAGPAADRPFAQISGDPQ